AAAEAMRRILIERARHKRAGGHGGSRLRIDVAEIDLVDASRHDDLLELDDALSRLAATEPDAPQLVKLRAFARLSVEQGHWASPAPRPCASGLVPGPGSIPPSAPGPHGRAPEPWGRNRGGRACRRAAPARPWVGEPAGEPLDQSVRTEPRPLGFGNGP